MPVALNWVRRLVSSSASAPESGVVSYRLVRLLFPRLLAVIYLIAFASWWVQWDALVGENGILPASQLMGRIAEIEQEKGISLFGQMPTLFHWRSDDAFAHAVSAICCVASLLVIGGILQGPLLLGLWFGYLSMAVTGDVFMGFQWDALLLEAGLLAVFVAPWRWWTSPSSAVSRDAPRIAIWLIHWLLFRLMFLSGWVKLAGGDPTWENLTALLYHYETQPLPNALSWYFHHQPRWLHIGGCAVMFVIEIALPFAIFAGRLGRCLAATGFILLMALVFVSGNYNFFNLLTVVLSLALLDDRSWPNLIRARCLTPQIDFTPIQRLRSFREWPSALFALPCLILTLTAADGFLQSRVPKHKILLPDWMHQAYASTAAWRSFNAYGLFQSMTTERREVIVEVSDDGIFWLPVEFRWKPGDLTRTPGWMAPHQPRLDWQMWFAALSHGYNPQRDSHPASPTYWFGQFLAALLQHKEPVWALLEPPPFPIEKISHVRARLCHYQFTSPDDRKQNNATWQREFLGPFAPALSLQR